MNYKHMKRIFRFLPIALMGMLILAGCEKDDSVILKATTERYRGVEKAYINNSNYACWSNGDRVKINSTVATATYTSSGSDHSYVTFTGVTKTDAGYYAIYPASACAGTFTSGASISLSNVQAYSEVDGKQVLVAPMAAKADGSNQMMFKNLCVLLKVHIPQANNSLRMIIIRSADSSVYLSGTGTVAFAGTEPSLTMASGQYNVALSFSTPKNMNVSGGRDFYIAIPALAASKQLQVFTKDIINQYRLVTVTSQQALHSNTIIGFDGPEMMDNGAYTFYDWIWSQKSGYVDLGVKPTVGAKMEMTFMIDAADDAARTAALNGAQYLGGSRGRTGDAANVDSWFTMGGPKDNVAGYFRSKVCGTDVKFAGTVPSRQVLKKYKFSTTLSRNGSGYIQGTMRVDNLTDGGYLTRTTASTMTDFPADVRNVWIFAEYYTGSYCYHMGVKCYGFKYYEGETLVHDFIPCKRISDNAIGVYDLKDGSFIMPTRRSATAIEFQVGNDPQP